MKFEEALRLMEKGEKIGCKEILSESIYMYKNKDEHKLHFWSTYCNKNVDDYFYDDNSCIIGFMYSMFEDIWELFEKPLLNRNEKSYLRNVLTPFKNKKITIKKVTEDLILTSFPPKKMYHIDISIDGKKTITFPSFAEGDMYNQINPGQEYTVDELGLFED